MNYNTPHIVIEPDNRISVYRNWLWGDLTGTPDSEWIVVAAGK